MTIIIFFFFSLTTFAILNTIMCSTLIKYMKKINSNQHDILDELEYLGALTTEDTLIHDELNEIKDRLTNLTYNYRHQ